MLGTHDLWTFLAASFLLWLTPGPDTMYILTRSISHGRRAGVMSALGIGSGLLIHTLLAAFGLSAILATSAWAFAVVKTAGAAYLIYLGLQALRKKVGTLGTPDLSPVGNWRVYRQGVVSNTLNPKVAIFFLALLPQFVDPMAGLGPMPFMFLGAIFTIGGTLWSLGLVVCAASATQTIRRNPAVLRWLERLSGCVYIALGLNLLRSKPHPA
ncbi:MAG TPA: LysE family translocator [Methylomirabilota bacterium]